MASNPDVFRAITKVWVMNTSDELKTALDDFEKGTFAKHARLG